MGLGWLLDAVDALAGRPVRTVLAVLGTLVGVTAFVGASGLGSTSAAEVRERFAALDAREISVSPALPGVGTEHFDAGALARLRAVPGVQSAGIAVDAEEQEVRTRRRRRRTRVSVTIVSGHLLAAARARPAAGRPFGPGDRARRRRVALVGAGLAADLGVGPIEVSPTIRVSPGWRAARIEPAAALRDSGV